MACVLTLAVMDDERVVVGHVGDSRLYLVWNGAIRKLTSDHSPVGEREDCGELSEREAMEHPRRHEVFRDVGSMRRQADEEDFIEMKEFLFKPDAAILLCSDGLSDQVTSEAMNELIERYDGDPDAVARSLVDAANRAGGSDNVTAIFVAGSEFVGSRIAGDGASAGAACDYQGAGSCHGSAEAPGRACQGTSDLDHAAWRFWCMGLCSV